MNIEGAYSKTICVIKDENALRSWSLKVRNKRAKIGSPTLQPTVLSLVAYTNVHSRRSSCDRGGIWEGVKAACHCD